MDTMNFITLDGFHVLSFFWGATGQPIPVRTEGQGFKCAPCSMRQDEEASERDERVLTYRCSCNKRIDELAVLAFIHTGDHSTPFADRRVAHPAFMYINPVDGRWMIHNQGVSFDQ